MTIHFPLRDQLPEDLPSEPLRVIGVMNPGREAVALAMKKQSYPVTFRISRPLTEHEELAAKEYLRGWVSHEGDPYLTQEIAGLETAGHEIPMIQEHLTVVQSQGEALWRAENKETARMNALVEQINGSL